MPKAKSVIEKTNKKAEEEVNETADETEETEEADVRVEDPEEVDEEETDEKSLDIVIVNEPGEPLEHKIFVRQYSHAVHGKNYKKLAAEFCTKKPKGKKGIYLAVPSEKIAKVEVRYREKKDADLHLDKQDPNAPVVDKTQVFNDKEEAVAFGASKYDATVIVSRQK